MYIPCVVGDVFVWPFSDIDVVSVEQGGQLGISDSPQNE